MSSNGGLLLFDYVNKNAYVGCLSLFSVVATLANLFLMIIILASPKFRTSSKHILIILLCVTDIYVGAFEIPLLGQFYSLEKWIHSVVLEAAVRASLYFVMLSLRINLVAAICANSILSVFIRNTRLLRLFSVSMIIAAIGYSMILVLPITDGIPYYDDGYVSVLAFFPQFWVMIVLVANIFIIHYRLLKSMPEYNGGEPKRFPVDVIMACFLMLVFVSPYIFAKRFIQNCYGKESCRIDFTVYGFTRLWEYVRPCVMPFVWLLCRETRMRIKHVCCCGRSEQSP